jgi:hypothetical protein
LWSWSRRCLSGCCWLTEKLVRIYFFPNQFFVYTVGFGVGEGVGFGVGLGVGKGVGRGVGFGVGLGVGG